MSHTEGRRERETGRDKGESMPTHASDNFPEHRLLELWRSYVVPGSEHTSVTNWTSGLETIHLKSSPLFWLLPSVCPLVVLLLTCSPFTSAMIGHCCCLSLGLCICPFSLKCSCTWHPFKFHHRCSPSVASVLMILMSYKDFPLYMTAHTHTHWTLHHLCACLLLSPWDFSDGTILSYSLSSLAMILVDAYSN